MDEGIVYWTNRAEGYSKTNQDELNSIQRQKWGDLIESSIPEEIRESKDKSEIKILDIGTGPGFFSIIMKERGYDVYSVDYTEEMLVKARKNAGELGELIHFMRMDAQKLEFDDHQFDFIMSRNLTWVLSEPKKAYTEWYRVLKEGGKMINFDANWYHHLVDEEKMTNFRKMRQHLEKEEIYDFSKDGEGIDNEWMDDIARQKPLTYEDRPVWDIKALKEIGFSEVETDEKKVYDALSEEEKINYSITPMFMIEACK